MRGRHRPPSGLAIVLSSLVGCVTPATSVLVTVETDAPGRVVSMRTVVARGSTLSMNPETRTWVRSLDPEVFTFPASFGISAANGSNDGPVIVQFEMSFEQPDTTVVIARRTARFRFVPHQPSEIRLYIPASCAALVAPPAHCLDPSVMCTVSQFCSEQSGLTCGDEGECVPTDVTVVPLGPDGSSMIDAHRSDAVDASMDADVPPPPPVPMITAPPTISSGSRHNGETVTVTSLGTWSNMPTSFAVQWLACDRGGNACTDVLGATDSSYTFAPPDFGSTFRIAVTATNAFGPSMRATSAPSEIVRDNLAYVQDHAFTSLPNPGQTTSAITLPSPTRAGSLLVASITTSITALDVSFTCNVPCSGWQSIIANPSGGAFEGWLFALPDAPAGITTVTASSAAMPTRWAWNLSEWSGAATMSILDGTPLGADMSGATVMSAPLTTTFGDDVLVAGLGNQSWQTTATAAMPFTALNSSRGVDTCLDQCSITHHTSYLISSAPGTFTSSWTAVSAGGTIEIAAMRARTEPLTGVPVATALPIVAGATRAGSIADVTTGVWTGATAFAYQWLRCDSSGTNCAPASGSGATTAVYHVDASDVGSTLRARVIASNAVGAGRALLSVPSGAIAP